MNINKKINILGKSSQVIAFVITFILIFVYAGTWYQRFRYTFGFWESIAFLTLILITLYVGYYNVNLYGKYKDFLNEKISHSKFNKIWYICSISTMIFLSFVILIVFLEKDIKVLLFTLIMIPQIFFLKNIYPNKINLSLYQMFAIEKYKIITKKIAPQSLTTKDIYVIPFIIGAIICLLFGYMFGETQYYTAIGKRVFYETNYSTRKFNNAVGIISYIVSTGICYLIINKIFNNSTIK